MFVLICITSHCYFIVFCSVNVSRFFVTYKLQRCKSMFFCPPFLPVRITEPATIDALDAPGSRATQLRAARDLWQWKNSWGKSYDIIIVYYCYIFVIICEICVHVWWFWLSSKGFVTNPFSPSRRVHGIHHLHGRRVPNIRLFTKQNRAAAKFTSRLWRLDWKGCLNILVQDVQ